MFFTDATACSHFSSWTSTIINITCFKCLIPGIYPTVYFRRKDVYEILTTFDIFQPAIPHRTYTHAGRAWDQNLIFFFSAGTTTGNTIKEENTEGANRRNNCWVQFDFQCSINNITYSSGEAIKQRKLSYSKKLKQTNQSSQRVIQDPSPFFAWDIFPHHAVLYQRVDKHQEHLYCTAELVFSIRF